MVAIFAIKICKDNCCFCCRNVQRQWLFLLSKCVKTAVVFTIKVCKDNCYFYCRNVQRQLLFLLSKCAKIVVIFLLKYVKISAIVPVQK